MMAQSLRKRPRIDYKELASGPSFPKDEKKTKTWSTRQFFELRIIDTKFESEKLYCRVHYIGWPSKYDEWRLASDIIDIPEEFLKSTESERRLFFTNLRIAIKEALHCQRRADSFVEIKTQITKDIYQELQALGTPKKRGQYLLSDIRSFDRFLGNGWNLRIINRHKDFAYIANDQLFFRLSEREPLHEFSLDGQPVISHRGFMLIIKFVRALGNREDVHLLTAF